MSWNQTKLLARGYNISKGRDNWKSLGIGDVIKSSNSLQTALESVVSTSSSGDTQLSTSGNPVGSIQEKPEESPIFGSTISYRKSESESFTSPLGDEITVSVFSKQKIAGQSGRFGSINVTQNANGNPLSTSFSLGNSAFILDSDNAGGSISIPLNGSMPLNVNYGINLNSGFSIGVSSRGDSSSGVNMSVKPGEAMTIGGAAILLLLTGTTSSGLILAL
jgi:hypothetical protein